MSKTVLVAALLTCCNFAQAQQAAETVQSRNALGMAAYASKDFAACARMLTELASDPAAAKSSSIPYNAACCQALSGNPQNAIALLDRASTVSLLAIKDVEADTDLASVRALPEWQALRQRIVAREDAQLAGLDRTLRDELLSRRDKDQDIRQRAMAAGNPPPKALLDEWTRIDHDNTEWMKIVLAKHGWPGKSLVGKDGAKAAWLFVQHADMDTAFQKQAVELLEVAVAKGEAEGGDLAYLVDRILTGEGKPQRYGSQYHEVDGKMVPKPVEDPENLDKRRTSVGLPPMADYDKLIQSNYKPTPPADTKATPDGG